MTVELITDVPSLARSRGGIFASAKATGEATARELWLIGGAAVALRIALFLLVSWQHHLTLNDWAMRDDGRSYIAYARALVGNSSQLTDYDRRVFPGYPALIAVVYRGGIPFTAAAVGIDWLSAGLVAVLGTRLFRDRRIGWAFTCLSPQYFMNSTLAMSEAPLLTLSLGGLYLANRVRPVAGGLLLGVAGLVRPMACFAVAGQFRHEWFRRRPKGRPPPRSQYGYVQGTSMATPNAAGVAALIISQYGTFPSPNPNHIHMSPTTVEQYLQVSSNNQPCPTPNTVTEGPGLLAFTATCQGNTGYNNFFGKGIVDALKAVTLKKP